MTLTAGSRLGPYEILSPLGAGGMGEVYRARDTRLERTVAVKVLSQHLSASPEVRQRFEREAKTISQLSHPHICALYDVGREGETEYLVMEYLEGETLAERLAKGALALEQTLRYGIEIANALDKAHRHGIVHRDLKPGNVMLTTSGVKLLDFGLAKALSSPAGSNAGGEGLTSLPTQAKNLTTAGTILGTFQYMAPEQLEGKEADARTDIFAFGAVLYEMATGEKAFTGATQASLISAILRDDPRPIPQVQPMTPPALDRLVRRCLVKDPERRMQNARDVALELEVSGGTDASAAEPTGRRRARMAMAGWGVAALSLLLLLAAVLGPWARKRTAAAAPVRFTILPAGVSPVGGMLALSPDGRNLAFVGTAADGRDLVFVRPLDSLEARALNGTGDAAFPFWSPDGRALAFFAKGKLKKIDAAGGAPQTLCDAPGARGGAWSPGGMIVFSSDVGGQMKIVSEAGGQARPLEQLISRNGELYRWPHFLPDGRHFLYFAFSSDTNRAGVFVTSLDSKGTTRLASGASGAAYAGPGYLFYRSGDQLVRQPFDARRLRLTGDAVPLVENIWWDALSTLATAFSVSESGVLAYQTGGIALSRLLWYDRSGREMGAIGPPGAYIEPALSPDGRWLAVTRGDQRAQGASIWTVDLERGNFARLSFEHGATPVWSPDGRRIAYCSFPSGEIWVRDIHGAEKEKLLHKAPTFTPLDDWSRDGRYLLHDVIDWKTFHFDVGVLDLQNGTERPLLTEAFNESGARLSPDGRWLAYESTESGEPEIFIRSFPEAKDRRQISSGGGSQPRWRGDGKELFFISPDRKVMAVDVRTAPAFEAGNPHVLFQTRILPLVEARNHYDVTADGRRFVVNSLRPEDVSLPITVVLGESFEPGK